MKKYTFTFPKSTTTKNNEYTNYSEIINDIILNNIKKNNPYLFTTNEENKPKKKINIDITLPKNKNIDINININKLKNYINTFLSKKNYNIPEDDYDFLLSDGTPVKLFSDEIQIGFDLLPLNAFTASLYDQLSKENKKQIKEIYIYIEKHAC